MTAPKGRDMSRRWRLVSVRGGPVVGTFWVSRPDRAGIWVHAVTVSVRSDNGPRFVTTSTALITPSGRVDIPEHLVDPRVWPDIEAQLDAFKAAVLAAAEAVEGDPS